MILQGTTSHRPITSRVSSSHNTAAGLLPFFVPHTEIQEPSPWATGVWKRVAIAAGLGLGLQWAVTGAGMLMYYNMHTVGLCCRTAPLLMHVVFGSVLSP